MARPAGRTNVATRPRAAKPEIKKAETAIPHPDQTKVVSKTALHSRSPPELWSTSAFKVVESATTKARRREAHRSSLRHPFSLFRINETNSTPPTVKLSNASVKPRSRTERNPYRLR